MPHHVQMQVVKRRLVLLGGAHANLGLLVHGGEDGRQSLGGGLDIGVELAGTLTGAAHIGDEWQDLEAVAGRVAFGTKGPNSRRMVSVLAD